MANITPDKQEKIAKVKDLCEKYPLVGVVNLSNLPMAQLQRMRKKLGSKVTIYLTKKRLIKIALEELKGDKVGIDQLEDKLRGIPALLFTTENPFKLYSLIQKSKSKAAAKAGQTAPNDILIQKGPTPFPPGPIISELGGFGLKTSVKGGKVEIMDDKIVAKEGEVITPQLASLLQKMSIEPMEIGLDLVAVYEDGNIFGKEVLAIDEKEYFNNFTQAERWAFNLAVEAGIMNGKTTEFMVCKAVREAKALALEANILADGVKEEVLAKASRQMQALQSAIGDLPAAAEESNEATKEKTENNP